MAGSLKAYGEKRRNDFKWYLELGRQLGKDEDELRLAVGATPAQWRSYLAGTSAPGHKGDRYERMKQRIALMEHTRKARPEGLRVDTVPTPTLTPLPPDLGEVKLAPPTLTPVTRNDVADVMRYELNRIACQPRMWAAIGALYLILLGTGFLIGRTL